KTGITSSALLLGLEFSKYKPYFNIKCSSILQNCLLLWELRQSNGQPAAKLRYFFLTSSACGAAVNKMAAVQ
ncbi:hypothetical protein XENOCAPTIV_002835, partial [Xenoophorus captivus]